MKKVVIMGASSGMGYALAEALASRGVKVGIAARHTSSMRELKDRYPLYVEYESIDITKRDAKAKLESLIDKIGGMDIYFHSAGIGYENLSLDPEREVEIIRSNAVGFARMLCSAYRYFRDNGRKGHIVAITSVAGTKGIGRLSAYSSTKKFDQTYINALESLYNAGSIENVIKTLHRLEAEYIVKRYGAYTTCKNRTWSFWMIYDRTGKTLEAFLSPGQDGERLNIITNTENGSLEEHLHGKGKTAIFFEFR